MWITSLQMWITQEEVDETPWKHGQAMSLAVPAVSAEGLLALSGWQCPMPCQKLRAVILVRREVRGKVLPPEPLREGGQVGVGVGPGPHSTPIRAQVQVLDALLVGDLRLFTRIP